MNDGGRTCCWNSVMRVVNDVAVTLCPAKVRRAVTYFGTSAPDSGVCGDWTDAKTREAVTSDCWPGMSAIAPTAAPALMNCLRVVAALNGCLRVATESTTPLHFTPVVRRDATAATPTTITGYARLTCLNVTVLLKKPY